MQNDRQLESSPLGTASSPPSNAYLDEAGHARLRQSIVGFIDILGFSQSIRTTSETGQSQELMNRILAAINDSRQFVRRSMAQEFASYPNDWALKFFSDNLVLGYPVESQGITPALAAWFIIRCTQRYQLRMALNSFFIRGALTQGPICLTDDIIFGAALLDCYHLESKTSIVPRVILAEPLWQLVQKSLREPTDPIGQTTVHSICRDIDGWWFVNYLEAAKSATGLDWEAIGVHKQSILQSLSNIHSHDVLPKYGWLCRYHNIFCHWHRDVPGYSDRYRIERLDEQSVICRLGDVVEQD